MRLVDSDLVGVALLLIYFGTVIGIAELWTRTRHPDPELPRKFIHILGGFGCLLFPFLIKSPLVVAGLATVFALTFALGRKSSLLQSISSVERTSRGSEYFPLAVALLFFICRDHLWLYLSALLILSVADAAAALIGTRFGVISYQVGSNDSKSLEGSLAFLVITFVVIFGLLAAMTDLAPANCAGAAFLTAILLTGIEAVSIHGTDNIYVPILTCYILLKITTKPLGEILFQCVSMVAIFTILLILIRMFQLFTIRDSIIFQLFAYATWSLGSVDWSIPIFIAFILYCCCRGFVDNTANFTITTRALMQLLTVPLILLVVANGSGLYQEIYGSFLMATIVVFICSTWVNFYLTLRLTLGQNYLLNTALAVFAPALFVVVNKLFHSHTTPFTVLIPMTTISLLITCGYTFYVQRSAPPTGEGILTRYIMFCSGCSAVTYLAVQSIGLIPYWQPAY